MLHFTADLHLGHTNIIRHCQRPFADVAEMDEALVANWNRKVGPGDEVIVVGDLAWRTPAEYVARLAGKISLVPGNHDERQLAALRRCLTVLPPLHELMHAGERIVLCHYALRTWSRSHHGSWHLFGHSHGQLPPHGRSFDVGVDPNGFVPLSFDEVRSRMVALSAAIATGAVPSALDGHS